MKAWQEAENLAADYLTRLGFKGVELETGGADGGVDVRVPDLIVAQVKATGSRVGRPVIQQIFGIGQAEGAQAVVFSLSGFSQEAIDWADEQTVSLFVFRKTIGGFRIKPVNPAAHVLIRWANKEYGINKRVASPAGWDALSGWEKAFGFVVWVCSSWLRLLVAVFIAVFLVTLVGSCLGGDDADESPRPTRTTRCPKDDLRQGEVCAKNPDLDGRCEFVPLEERSEYWYQSSLCPSGYWYIQP